MLARRLSPLALGALPVMVAAACYGPTSMRVEVLTDLTCPEQPHAAIYNGGDADPLGETSSCVAADAQTQTLGDLLFAPKSDRGATVTVKVQMAVGPNADPKRCASTPDQCVFASRKFTYVEHESSRLSVRLYRDCLGKVCDPGFTCIQGRQCVPEAASCQGGTCSVAQEKPFVATNDAGPADAGDLDATLPEASVDAGFESCVNPNGTDVVLKLPDASQGFAASSTAFYWTEGTTPFAIRQLLRADLGAGPVPTPLSDKLVPFDTFLALAAGPDGPWLAFKSAGKPFIWNIAGSAAVPNAVSVAGDLVVVFAAANGGATTAGFFLHDTWIERRIGAGLVTNFFTTPSASTYSIGTYDASYLYATLGDNVRSYSLLGAGPEVSLSFIPSALGTNGQTAFGGTTIGSSAIASLGQKGATNLVPAGTATSIAADSQDVYWIEGNRILRFPVAVPGATTAGEEVVSAATAGAPLSHLHVDPGSSGCIFAWSADMSGGQVAKGPSLRIWPKHK